MSSRKIRTQPGSIGSVAGGGNWNDADAGRKSALDRFIIVRRSYASNLIRCWLWILLLATATCAGSKSAFAALQFDVFPGFDDTIREGNWFPVTFEVLNDGPSFTGTIEFSSSQMGSGFSRKMTIELPTNTRKRLVIPAHASSRFSTWDARLLDERGRSRAEKTNIRLTTILAPGTFLAAAVPKSQAGRPELPELRGASSDRQPRVVRLTSELVPDNPISLEGLKAFYLTSERAVELKPPQVTALITWVYQGGHLIIGAEQSSDFGAANWLKRIAPFDVTGSATRKMSGELTAWLVGREAPSVTTEAETPQRGNLSRQGGQRGQRSRQVTIGQTPNQGSPQSQGLDPSMLKNDPVFDQSDLVTMTGRLQPGARTLLDIQGESLVSTVSRGRGKVTLLGFSPDREPFKAWSNRSWFWAKAFDLPSSHFLVPEQNVYAGMGSDGIFGAMIDSRQVRKLPVEWLLLLLVVYLAVIGPVDQYVLKKLNRQMLTWITFPAYVAFFSVLIYFIASRLRAGDMEWNEIHLVDIVPHGEKADIRGRTFGSLYSPVNARYDVAATNHGFSALRSEYHGVWGAGQDSTRMNLVQKGNGYSAELFVPVWTSQLFVSDWLRQDEAPLSFNAAKDGTHWLVTIQNNLPRTITNAFVVLGGRVYTLNQLPASKSITATMNVESGLWLRDFLIQHGSSFASVVQGRRQAFGRQSGRLDNPEMASVAASFAGGIESQPNGTGFFQGNFVYPEGLDISPIANGGGAILLAWDGGNAPVEPIIRFKPIRSQKNTLYRVLATSEPTTR